MKSNHPAADSNFTGDVCSVRAFSPNLFYLG
jgi:hypothetical protein